MTKAWAERLPSGNYSGRFRHPYTGKKERTGSFPSEDAALAAARRELRELVRLFDGDPDISPVSGAPTLSEYAAEAIDALPHVRPTTRTRYHTIARQLVKHFGGKVRVDQLTESSARSLVAACNQAGLAHSTIELRTTVLKHVVDQARREHYTTQRPDDWDVPLPSELHRQRDLLDDDTVGLITCAMPYRLWVAVLLSRDTGLRISEVAGLRVADIDPARRTLKLVGSFDGEGTWREHTKGHRSGVTLPLTRRLATALASHLTNHVTDGQEWLFADLDGTPIGIQRLRRAWNRARVVAGRPVVVWHDLRRTLITTLSDVGAPLQHLQALAGHSNPKTTRNYIQRVRTEDLAQWTDLIDAPDTRPEPEVSRRHLRAV